ncbi:hypothetical protein [Flavobacterium sp. AG291]|uniref:hypothetical protein n=1 Tax=Flavobacterium sp. AG291 TaxID=2184000 RepID=UPI000E0B37C7|nr:hypothetical protein [Flavobacterium sp. AG291]RDI05386.1 hypothetical protein DEU42_11859 [Flavobacterium sp. AG291]
MKKKLEAELISIAHRILKLKNRAELDQLQQETLKLYEKISVLRFVEDNFSDVKPTIGHASAEEALEEIYGLEEEPKVHANEVEAAEAKAKEEKAKAAEAEVKEEPKTEEPKPEEAEGKNEEVKVEPTVAEGTKAEEPVAIPELETSAEELKEREEAVVAVFEKEEESTPEEEEKATDAEVETIAPDENTKIEDSGLSFKLAFEEEAPAKQKEITFEDYKDYVEPEFVKKEDTSAKKAEGKSEEAKVEEPLKEETKEPEYRDWLDWEPTKSEEPSPITPKGGTDEVKAEEPLKEEPKAEPVAEEAKAQNPEPRSESTVRGNIATRSDFERPKSLNDALGKMISLGLNDRIAFEKNLFSGSADDLNRVLSQLNTINNYDEAKDFIDNLVKPDYNNWEGKEEYEERFMAIVEKKFA